MSDFVNNKIPCDVIQDIIPLYHDNVCSESSRKYVDEHIASCKDCSSFLKSLDEDILDRRINSETTNVLARHAKHERTVAAKIGMVIAGVLMLPIIIMLIVTMAGGVSIKTTLVLVASMLLTAGLTVVPLMSKTKKLSRTIIFSTLALLLVILFAQMFFYSNGVLYFLETAFSVIFGLSIVFFPIVVRQANLPDGFKNQKGLITFVWDTVWFYLMMITFSISFPNSARDLILIGTFGIALPWLIFLVARYVKNNRLVKTGLILFVIDAWLLIGVKLNWITIAVGNKPNLVSSVIYIGLAAIGLLLFGVGLILNKNDNSRG